MEPHIDVFASLSFVSVVLITSRIVFLFYDRSYRFNKTLGIFSLIAPPFKYKFSFKGTHSIFDSIFISISDLISWSNDLETSCSQIQKLYEWHINQWNNIGKIILTALLAFLSTVLLGILKGEISLVFKEPNLIHNISLILIIISGIISSLTLYFFSIYKTRRLKKDFLSIYRILQKLS